ncbi:histamine H2 receptor-like [Ptychodera flava]|uniref:histamine H2 receptor-like n=1 Tax=Ptychodera flava TaxID=63121 RepID=UPI00396A0784
MVDHQDPGTAVIVIQATVIVTIAALIISSNLLNIAVLSRNKILSIGGRCFMMSLAAADLLVGLLLSTTLVGCVTRKDLIAFAFPGCFFLGSLSHIAYSASSIALALIAVDRYLSIERPIQYINTVTKSRVVIVTIVAWTVLTFYAIAVGLIEKDFHGYNPDVFMCIPKYAERYVAIFSGTAFVMIPFGAMIFAYTRILVIARNRRRRIGIQQQGGSSSQNLSDMKAVKMFLAITAAFFLAWTPYGTLQMYFFISGKNDEVVPQWLGLCVTWILSANSFWNVIIYSAMNRSFRRAAFAVLEKLPCFGKKTPVENITINTVESATDI